MLDKSIPYKNIYMEISPEKISRISEPVLPDGFSFRFFTDGDEKHWARIESSVLEFDSAEKAENYFKEGYLPFPDLLKQRCVFVLNPEGLPVATAIAWIQNGSPWLHWVAVSPDYQGKGLGKAVIQKTLKIFSEKESGKSVTLHTQTWSHKAVRIYGDLGFFMLKDKNKPALRNNEYEEAMRILKEILDENTFRKLSETAR